MSTLAVEWLSVADVATVFGVSEWTIYDLCAKGQIPHGRFGRRLVFNKAEVEAWVRGEVTPSVAEPEPEELRAPVVPLRRKGGSKWGPSNLAS